MSNEIDITVEQHASFVLNLSLTDVSGSLLDVTTWDFSGSVKRAFKDTEPTAVFAFLTGSAVTGSISAYLTSEETGKLVKTAYVYDILGINPNTTPTQVLRLAQGVVNVDLGVTDPPVET